MNVKKTPDFELPEFVLRFDQDVGKKPNFLLIIIFYHYIGVINVNKRIEEIVFIEATPVIEHLIR
ncbi:MAG: hypothetical protein CMM12_02750 [Rhodospirillaceae bacterium]|nr:hypothetical protein [Rhodospirillaceae bacterium]